MKTMFKRFCSLIFIAAIIVIVFGLSFYNQNQITALDNKNLYRNTDLVEITGTTHTKNTNLISISDTSSSNTYSDKTITISSALELVLFSNRCEENSEFLGYQYKLTTDIDFGTNKFMPVGYQANKPFSGTFDGNGYTIKGLAFKTFEASEENNYKELEYVAMFSVNSGTIKNLKLLNTEQIQRSIYASIFGISPFVGLNKASGVIENCSIIDLRDPVNDEAGITALGGYRISGFVCNNEGTIKNSYVDYSIIVNYTITDYIDFRPITTINSGTITNTYFLDASIDSYDENYYYYDKGLLGNIKVEKASVTGEYVADNKTLNNLFTSIDGWYTDNMYEHYNMHYGIPSLIGLKEGKLNDEYVLEINDAKDFAYIYTLANANSFFASKDVTYYIKNDIDLSEIPDNSYAYDDFFSAKIIGNNNVNASINVANGYVNGVTIYNFVINNTIAYSGFECYGLFPLFDGIIENINFYVSDTINNINSYNSSLPTKAIGLICGINEGGSIKNARCYSNINLSSNMGRYYAGGACGIMTRNATISMLTTNGSILGVADSSLGTTFSGVASGYADGVCLGGVVGFSEATSLSIKDVLSKTSLSSSTYSNIATNYYIGGIVGAGYFNEANGLFYKGSITNSFNNSFNSLYASGDIGIVLGVKNSILNLHNQGDINITTSITSPNINISGCINVSLSLSSKLKEFYGNNYSNGGTISYENTNTTPLKAANISGVILLDAATAYKSTLIGIYNLGYHYNDSYAPTANTKEDMLDVSSYIYFGACVLSNATTSANQITLTRCYNLRNLSFITKKQFTNTNATLILSGCIAGKYIMTEEAYNEGNISYDISNNISLKRTIIIGIIEEVSNSMHAYTLYNGGNINIYISNINLTSVSGDIFASGICYYNALQNEDFYKNNVPMQQGYNNKLVGSIDKAINKGNITANAKSIEALADTKISSQNQGSLNLNTSLNGVLTSNLRCSGICSLNESIISNSMNLGDIIGYTAFKGSVSHLELAGIALFNITRYAQIRDCANNGMIKGVNMSSYTNSFVHVAGICTRNDYLYQNDTFTDYGKSNLTNEFHTNQLIAFTINYGTIIAFNYRNNVDISTGTILDDGSTESHAKASGILGIGLCSILNTLNYGTICGSETNSGIFGYVFLNKFKNDISASNKVNIANSINYGNVRSIDKTNTEDYGTYYTLSYNEINSLNATSSKFYSMANVLKYQYNGSIIGLAHFNNLSNAQFVNIRYLINFNREIPVVACETRVPDGMPANSDTLLSTYRNDTYLGNDVVYSPLSSISDEYGNIGVFSPDFSFRKMIEGKLTPEVESDNYIPDYFQFVGFTKINTILIESIGWRTIAFANAAEGFANNLEKFIPLIENFKDYSSQSYDSMLSSSLSSFEWLNNCDTTVLKNTFKAMTNNYDYDKLKEIINYLFFEASNKTTISNSLRSLVVDELYNSLDASDENLRNVLNGMMMPEVMANLIAKSDTEYANIESTIKGYIQSLDESSLKELLENYLNLMQNTTSYNDFFSNSDLIPAKEELLTNLLNSLSDEIIEELYNNIDKDNYDSTAELATILRSNEITDSDKQDIYLKMLTNNANNLDNLASSIKTIYKKVKVDDANITDSEANAYKAQISSEGYVDIWNAIRNNSKVKNYLTNTLANVTSYDYDRVKTYKGIYAKATEYRNAYQSNDAPVELTVNGSLYTGALRATTRNTHIATRYIYVPDDLVSDVTYFYGPYKSSAGDSYVGTLFPESSIGFSLFDNSSSGGTSTRRYVPLYVSLTEQEISDKIALSNNKTVYKFLWNSVPTSGGGSTLSQYVSENILNTKPDDVYAPLFRNTTLSTTNPYYKYGIDLDETTKSSWTTNSEASWTGTQLNSSTAHTMDFMWFYCSASIMTGIYYQQDQWGQFGAYLTAKENNYENNYRGVVTTSYIDYSVDDIILLDGVKTMARCSGATSTDEVEIIQNIMANYMLASTEGIKVILSCLGEYGVNGNASSTYASIMTPYLYAFQNDTDFVNSYIMNVAYDKTSYDLTYNITTTGAGTSTTTTKVTIADYIKNTLGTRVTFTNKENIILMSVGSSTNFSYIINYLYNNNYLTNLDLVDIISTVYGTNEARNLLTNKFDSNQISTLIKSLANKDDTSLLYLLNNIGNDIYINSGLDLANSILDILLSNNSSLYFDTFTKMNNIDEFNSNTNEIIYFISAFIGQDYIQKQNAAILSTSYLYQILNELNGNNINGFNHSDVNFINADNTTNNDKLYNLLVLYNYPLATDGYGLYAVASSKGILNGNFIPDNINLSDLDPYYNNSNGYLIVTEANNSSWRGGMDGATPIISDDSSVNYDFYVSMKQLIKSIATTIFDIELVSTDGEDYLITNSSFIDLKNGTIKFYMYNNYNELAKNKEYKVNLDTASYELAYRATFDNLVATSTVTLGNKMIVRVYAEDTTVYKDYEIEIVDMTSDLSFSIDSASINDVNASFVDNEITSELASTGGHMVINLTTNLVANTNLESYLVLEDEDGNIYNASEYLIFDNAAIVDGNRVVLDLTIDSGLSYGNKLLSFVFGSPNSKNIYKYSIKFGKEKSNDTSLKSITFDESDITFTNNIAISHVLAGRVFNYNDLVSSNGMPSYIEAIDMVKTASVTTSAVLYNATNYVDNLNGLILINSYTSEMINRLCYMVTYTITAETGDEANYYHYIIEDEPYQSYNDYVSIYKDGLIDNTASIDQESGEIATSFTRGFTPKYRFNYSFTGFYDYDNITNYIDIISDGENIDNQLYSMGTKYFGAFVNFYDLAEPDDYIYNIRYTSNSFNWNGNELHRLITLPDIIVSKLLSVDAYMKKITFISEAQKISDLATVGALQVIYPSGNKTPLYQDLVDNLNATTNKNDIISSSSEGLIYSDAAKNVDKYYLVGTVSNTTLEDYAPTFILEEHASIYQFKIINNNKYLYIPFENVNDESIMVFLVLESDYLNNESYTIYDTSYTGSEAGYSFNNTVVYENNTYKLSTLSGSVDSKNRSLFMDYVGMPEENEFWYVSYIVYAENKDYSKVYDIAILDLTNTILFDIKIKDESENKLDTSSPIYLTIVAYKADGKGTAGDPYTRTDSITYTISAFAFYDEASGCYLLNYSLQKLEFSFFEFFLDLEYGYETTYKVASKKANNNPDKADTIYYLPPSSIVTQKIDMEFTINENTKNYVWGEKYQTLQGVVSSYNGTFEATK